MQMSKACVQTPLYTHVLIQEYEINAAFLLTQVPGGIGICGVIAALFV